MAAAATASIKGKIYGLYDSEEGVGISPKPTIPQEEVPLSLKQAELWKKRHEQGLHPSIDRLVSSIHYVTFATFHKELLQFVLIKKG